MDKIKVAVADDIEYIREYYQLMFDKSERFECVGTARNEAETVEKARELQPDILLSDIQMERMDSGIRIIPDVLSQSPCTKIIMLTVHEDTHLIFEAFRLGAKDFIIKGQPWETVQKSIIAVYNETEYIRSDIAKKLLGEIKIIEEKQNSLLYIFSKFASLSNGEIEILRLMCDGLTPFQIAEARFVEDVTIRSAISRILKKLEYRNAKVMVKHIKELKIFELLDNAPR
jgi:DNA-binding NarL/FixJ family response regulator